MTNAYRKPFEGTKIFFFVEITSSVLATDLLYLYEMDKKWALYFLPKRPLEVIEVCILEVILEVLEYSPQ